MNASITQTAKSIPFSPRNGFNSKNLQDAVEESRNLLRYNFVSATSNVSTSSNQFVLIDSMSITPAAGTYLVIFNASSDTAGVNGSAEVAIFSAGSQVNNSTRDILCHTELLGAVTLSSNYIGGSVTSITVVTVNGSQAIEAKFRAVSGDSIIIVERNMTVIRLA